MTPQCLSRRAASGSAPSSSLAADFSERFKFGEAPKPAPAPRQPSQQDTAQGIPREQPSAAAAPAQLASDAAQTASPGSSGSFSSGLMNGPAIGVRPSGTSRLGGHASADRDIGRRATKTETAPSRGHGEGARFGRADVRAKSGGADVGPRSAGEAAPQPPLSHRLGVPENDRARANLGSTKPVPVGKPARAPAARDSQEAAVGGNAAKQASASPDDADMRDASPGETKAESKGSDCTAPFGFTEAAMPAGMKFRAAESSRAAAQATHSQIQDGLAALLAAEVRANMDRCFDPEQLSKTIHDELRSELASKAAAQEASIQADYNFLAQFAAKPEASSDRQPSPEALNTTFKLHSERGAHGGRKLHKGMTDGADSSACPEFPPRSSEQKGDSVHDSGSHSQAHAGTSQQGAGSGSLKANGFTLGSFSRLHKKKPPAAAATRARVASHSAKQEPAAEPGHGESQAAGRAPDSTEGTSLSDKWRIYAQELHAEKSAEAAETAGWPRDAVGAPASGSVPGSAQTPVETASTSAPAESSSKTEAMGSAASFVTARSSPEVESVPDLAETLLKRWEAAAKEQPDTKEEDSLASKLRQQTLGESDDADTAASADAGAAAASKTSTMPPAKQSEQPSASFPSAARGASIGAGQAPPAAQGARVGVGQAPTAAQGATFGLGQAPKAPRMASRRSRGRARAAPSRSQWQSPPAQPAGSASEPPPVPGQTFFASTQSATSHQPSTTDWGASGNADPRPQQAEPTTQQQPIFGFHAAPGADSQQQGSEAKPQAHFGWSSTGAGQGSRETAPAQAQAPTFGPKPFSFKSPGSSKVRAPSEPRSPQPSGFTWGQVGGVAFTKPPSPSKAFAGARDAELSSSEAAQPAGSFASAEAPHNEVQRESAAASKVEFAGVQPVRVAVFPPTQVPQPQGTATDPGRLLSPGSSACKHFISIAAWYVHPHVRPSSCHWRQPAGTGLPGIGLSKACTCICQMSQNTEFATDVIRKLGVLRMVWLRTGAQAGPEQPPATPLQDVERLRQRGNDAFQRGSYARSVDLYQRVGRSCASLSLNSTLSMPCTV